MEQKNRFEIRWEKIRTQNKWKYYFIYGSIEQGGILAIILTLVDLALKDFSILKAILRLFIFLILDFIYGMWKWKFNEKNYQKYLNKL